MPDDKTTFKAGKQLSPTQVYCTVVGVFASKKDDYELISTILDTERALLGQKEFGRVYRDKKSNQLYIWAFPGKDNEDPTKPERPLREIHEHINTHLENLNLGKEVIDSAVYFHPVCERNSTWFGERAHFVFATKEKNKTSVEDSKYGAQLLGYDLHPILQALGGDVLEPRYPGPQGVWDNTSCGHFVIEAARRGIEQRQLNPEFDPFKEETLREHYGLYQVGVREVFGKEAQPKEVELSTEDGLRQEVADLNEKLQRALGENRRLKNRVNERTERARVNSFAKKSLAAQLSRASSSPSPVPSPRNQSYQELEANVVKLKAEITGLEKRNRELFDAGLITEAHSRELAQRLQELDQTDKEKLSSELASAQRDLEFLRAENDRLEDAVKEARKPSPKVVEQTDNGEQEDVGSLQVDLDIAQEEKSLVEKENTTLRARVGELEAENERLKETAQVVQAESQKEGGGATKSVKLNDTEEKTAAALILLAELSAKQAQAKATRRFDKFITVVSLILGGVAGVATILGFVALANPITAAAFLGITVGTLTTAAQFTTAIGLVTTVLCGGHGIAKLLVALIHLKSKSTPKPKPTQGGEDGEPLLPTHTGPKFAATNTPPATQQGKKVHGGGYYIR